MKQSKEREEQIPLAFLARGDKRLMRFQFGEIGDYPDGVVIHAEEQQGNISKRQTDTKIKLISVRAANAIVFSTDEAGSRSCFMEQNIIALAHCSKEPNLIIFDTAMESYSRLAKTLSAQGYQVSVLDFSDLASSDKWNPYAALIWRVKLIRELSNELDNRDGKYYAASEMFSTYKEVRTRLDELNEELYQTAESITNRLFRLDGETAEEEYARKVITAFTLAICEDCIASRLGTAELILSNVYQNLLCYANGQSLILKSYLIGKRSKRSKAKALAEEIFHGRDPESLGEIMKSVIRLMNACCSDKLLNFTCEDWVDLWSETDIPMAVFIVLPKEDTVYQRYVELFLSQTYVAREEVLATAAKRMYYMGRGPVRPCYYVINGYQVLPKTTFFGSLFSDENVERRLILITNSHEQIVAQYGEEFGDWVMNECQVKLFLNAENPKRQAEYFRFSDRRRAECADVQVVGDMELFDKVSGLGYAVAMVYDAEPFVTKFTPSYKLRDDLFPEGDKEGRVPNGEPSYLGTCFDIAKLLGTVAFDGALNEEVETM